MTTISNGKYRLEIFHDENCESPRENECNSCIMVCFHKRYNLGDKHDLKIGDYSSWAEVETEIKKDIMLRLYPRYIFMIILVLQYQPFHFPPIGIVVKWGISL